MIRPGSPATTVPMLANGTSWSRRAASIEGLCLAAISRPPEVWASARIICSGSGRSPKSVCARTDARFRFVPPGTTSRRARSRTRGSINGIAPASSSAAAPDASSIRCRWPSRPNPVTSVAASATAFRIASAAARFVVVISATAAATRSSSARPRLIAVETIPRPSGFVRNSPAPAGAVELRTTSSGSTRPSATMPYFGSGSVIEWPPATTTPSAVATSTPPWSTWASISSGRSSTGQFTMLSARSGRPPIA